MMIKKIFQTFHAKYGKQNWWPVTQKGETQPKYTGGPKTVKQKLEVIFGAILTQNTSWKNVEKAIINLNKKNLIDVDKILKISNAELAELIKSSGYFNQKAKKLKNIAKFLKKFSINRLGKLETNKLKTLLLQVNGIGPETADSIILYAFNKPIFVVDAYTKRIFSRIGLVKKKAKYEEIQDFFHKNIKKNSKLFNEYHALIVRHAKKYCRKKPFCKECIIKNVCNKIVT